MIYTQMSLNSQLLSNTAVSSVYNFSIISFDIYNALNAYSIVPIFFMRFTSKYHLFTNIKILLYAPSCTSPILQTHIIH